MPPKKATTQEALSGREETSVAETDEERTAAVVETATAQLTAEFGARYALLKDQVHQQSDQLAHIVQLLSAQGSQKSEDPNAQASAQAAGTYLFDDAEESPQAAPNPPARDASSRTEAKHRIIDPTNPVRGGDGPDGGDPAEATRRRIRELETENAKLLESHQLREDGLLTADEFEERHAGSIAAGLGGGLGGAPAGAKDALPTGVDALPPIAFIQRASHVPLGTAQYTPWTIDDNTSRFLAAPKSVVGKPLSHDQRLEY